MQSKASSIFLKTYAEPRTILTTFAIFLRPDRLFAAHIRPLFCETPEQRVAMAGMVMLSPNIICFAIFFAGLYCSPSISALPKACPVVHRIFVGLSNYRNILSIEFKIQSDLRNVNTMSSTRYHATNWPPTMTPRAIPPSRALKNSRYLQPHSIPSRPGGRTGRTTGP
jgi:hypothetical protein